MKLSQLLATRQSILRQAYLASLAHAYVTLKGLAERIAAAKLRGRVRLQPADPGAERYCATLTALEGPQSVIEEHFADGEIMDLADLAVFALEAEYDRVEFPLEEMAEVFVQPLRTALDEAGVELDLEPKAPRLPA